MKLINEVDRPLDKNIHSLFSTKETEFDDDFLYNTIEVHENVETKVHKKLKIFTIHDRRTVKINRDVHFDIEDWVLDIKEEIK